MSEKKKFIIRRQNEPEKETIAEAPKPEPKPQKPLRPKRVSRLPQSTIDTSALLDALEDVDDDFLEALIDDSTTMQVHRGDTVTGQISEAHPEFYLISIGAKSEAFINVGDITGGPYSVGETIKATVMSAGTNGIRLTMILSDSADREELFNAFESKTPVVGTVKERNSGGYTVIVAGQRAFCPMSQIDLNSPSDPDIYLNQQYTFQIQELSEKDMTVSRRVLLEVEAAERAAEVLQTLQPDTTVTGIVQSLKDFGIFVDIGGIQGLIPKSQFKHFNRMPIEGDSIEVDIIHIDQESQRISLRPQFDDPWLNLSNQYNVNDVIEVTVTKVESFGLFAQIRPGVEGLIHIRNLSNKRVHNIQAFTSVGNKHTVRILEIDITRRRIGLGIRQVESPESGQIQDSKPKQFVPKNTEPSVSHLGQLLQGLGNHKENKGNIKKRKK